MTCVLYGVHYRFTGLQIKFRDFVSEYSDKIRYSIVFFFYLILFSTVSSCSPNSAYSDNLLYANLSYSNLSYANLSYSNLSYANLYGTDLSYANLSYTNLFGADLSNATLHNAILSNATLHNAILFGADLTSADLANADLANAILTYADLTGTDLRGSDLSDALIVALFDFTDLTMDNRTILEGSLIENQELTNYISQWKTRGKLYLIENEHKLKEILVSRGFTEYYVKFIITISKLPES
jgi:hypothetical protein